MALNQHSQNSGCASFSLARMTFLNAYHPSELRFFIYIKDRDAQSDRISPFVSDGNYELIEDRPEDCRANDTGLAASYICRGQNRQPRASLQAYQSPQRWKGEIKMVLFSRSSVCVPRTRNRQHWLQRLFYSQGTSQLKCLSVLVNDTSLQTITHREWRTNVKQINQMPTHLGIVCTYRWNPDSVEIFFAQRQRKNLSQPRSEPLYY